MKSSRTIFMKKNRKIYSSDVRAEFRDNFDMIKRYKNLFRKKNSLIESKKSLYKTHNLYRSFINSSFPYNYFQVPNEKNTFLIHYNGGPKIYTYVEKNKLNKELDTKEIIYGDKKNCGCFTKLYVPKLKRCLSNLENYRIKDNKFGFKRPNSSFNPKFLLNKSKKDLIHDAIKFENKTGAKRLEFSKKFYERNDNYRNLSTNFINRTKINFENSKDECDDKKIVKTNKYDSLLYNLNRNIDKKFHKTQIFDSLKPFLSEGM